MISFKKMEFPFKKTLPNDQAKNHTGVGTALLFIVMALYCVVGFTGFDPARQDEAYIFGIILEYWRGHSWVVPLLAGEPFMEKPPLYYLIGAASARLFSSILPLHDAARLASAFFIVITLLTIAAAGRLVWGRGYGRFAALALLCSLGLAVPSHMMLTDNAQLTGIAMALLGFTGVARKRWWSGSVLGTGAGIAFLSKGLLGPGIIAITAMLLLCFSAWRNQRYFIALLIALIAALPWLCVWPYLLYRESPDLFAVWLGQNNFGRFLGYAPASLNAVKDSHFWYTTLWWSSFPTLPLALLSMRRVRSQWHELPAIQIGLAFCIALIGTLALSSTLRAIYALPLLLALALIAAPSLREPPEWLNRIATNSGQWFFLIFLLVCWTAWCALVFQWLPQGSVIGTISVDQPLHVNRMAVFSAVAVTGGWVICQRCWRNQPWRAGAVWYSSLFGAFAILALLWLPLLDQKSSYRDVFKQLAHALPKEACVNSVGLGESQRGMLDYVLDVQTVVTGRDGGDAYCNALLIDGAINEPLPLLTEDWHLVWTGRRSPDAHEQFWLYTRRQPDMDATEIVSRRRHTKHRAGEKRSIRRRV